MIDELRAAPPPTTTAPRPQSLLPSPLITQRAKNSRPHKLTAKWLNDAGRLPVTGGTPELLRLVASSASISSPDALEQKQRPRLPVAALGAYRPFDSLVGLDERENAGAAERCNRLHSVSSGASASLSKANYEALNVIRLPADGSPAATRRWPVRRPHASVTLALVRL